MEELKFTPAQQSALDVSGRDVLVSAAAGSGKTFTLTQRIIKNILEKNASISRILVVTFTKAAASQLKSKISSALMDAIAKHPDNTHLQNQILLLGDADICTIDSFLSRPVRENFEKLGLPASMRIADDAEISSIISNVLSDVMQDLYIEYGVSDGKTLADINFRSPLTDLIYLLSSTKDSSEIFPSLLKLYDKLITTPSGVELLKDFSKRLRDDASKDFLHTKEGEFILNTLNSIIEGTIEFYENALVDIYTDEYVAPKYGPNFEDDKSELISIQASLGKTTYEELKARLEPFPSTSLSRMSKGKTPHSEALKNARTSALKPIKELRASFFTFSEEEIKEAYLKTAEITLVIYRILSEFDKRFMAEKLRMGIYQFSDMPRYMLRLLQNPDGTQSEAAKILSGSYDEIYIDEYQDVNAIQDKIFTLLSSKNRFMVGDIKQSIYGFRDAEPVFFTNYRNSFPPYSENEASMPDGSTIFMSENFRSDENVIKFSNIVCAPIFKSCGEEISYDSDSDDLVFNKNHEEDYTSPKVQVNIFAKGDPESVLSYLPSATVVNAENEPILRTDGLDEEAVFTANEIARLIRCEKRADGKSIKPSDIAVLVRKKEEASSLMQALSRLNIEYLVASKSQLLTSREMTLLVCLCEIIDNPRHDISLCSVLGCEYLPEALRFSTGEIITIRSHSGKNLSLYDSILKYANDGEGDPLQTLLCAKCRNITDKLSALRSYSIKLSAEKFLRLLSADGVFSALCDCEAFRFLYDCACKYVRSSWNGLSGFVKYFKNIVEHGNVSGEVKPVENAVNILTMHYSKGLQYNTCFVYGCGTEINFMDSQKAVMYDKDLCLGMQIPKRADGEVNTVKHECIISKAVAESIRKRARSEEMRILYVAMTRAEERLYISGSISTKSHFESFFKRFALYGRSQYATHTQSSLISWVIGGMCLCPYENGVYDVTLHSIFNNTELCEPFAVGGSSPQVADNAQLREYAALSLSPPSLSREEIILSSIPAKAAASKASEKMLDESVFSALPSGILFSNPDDEVKEGGLADNAEIIKNRISLMRSSSVTFDSLLDVNKKPTAAERGTAMHLFLQYCDYQSVVSLGVEAETERLRDAGYISERTAKILSVPQLKKFFKSEFFGMILNAKSVRREFKFGMFRSASEFTQNKELSELVRERKIYIQGSIDLIVENSDGSIYVCDYKTDRISAEEKENHELLRARMREAHKDQLEQYRYAVKQIFGKEPEKIFILSLSSGLALEI